MEWKYILGGILALVLFCVVLALEDVRVDKLKQHGVRTQGVVIRNNFYLRGGINFRPVLQFNTDDGRTFELEERRRGSLAPRYNKGQIVALLYDQQDPANFIILGPQSR